MNESSELLQDNYAFYKCEIVELPSNKDSRATIRIIPHMNGIDQIELLPKYPSFFKDENFGGMKIGDILWALALSDFTTGWILGPANTYSFNTESDNSDFNRIMESFSQKLKNSGFGNSNIDSLRVFFWNSDIIDIYDSATKSKITLNKDGSYLAMTEKRTAIGYKGKSSISLSDNGISFTTDGKVTFNAKEGVSFGGNGNAIATVLTDSPSDGQHTVIIPAKGLKA